MIEGTGWIDPDAAGWVRSLTSPADWDLLVADYGGELDAHVSFRQMVDVLRSNECSSVVIENRYVDPDYRSEYSAFWSTRFEDVPAFARRLHFFRAAVSAADLPELPEDHGYLGYCVVRPTPLGRMGRTVILPPKEMATATFASIDDSVTLFGNRLPISGAAPFLQQDREFLTCSQAALWMCHYTAAKRGLVGRRLTASLIALTPTFLSPARPLPSSGIDQRQIQAVFGATGQPALLYGLRKLPDVLGAPPYDPPSRFSLPGRPPDYLEKPGYWDRRIISIACRYLNSGYPVFVATEDHAFVLVGWWREGEKGPIHFAANDDRKGPYLKVHPFTFREPWLSLMIPLPPKVLMTAESAENNAYDVLRYLGTAAESTPEWREVARGMPERKTVSLRVALRDGSDYKLALDESGLDPEILRELRLARLSHYVWVVEARVRDVSEPNQPSVVAEFVYDSTSPDRAPRQLAVMLLGAH